LGGDDVAAHDHRDFRNPYGFPSPAHWGKFVDAWTKSNYGTYFWNSTIVVVAAVALVTVIGAMAGALPRPLHVPRQSAGALWHSHRAGPAAATRDPCLVPDLLDINLYNTLTGLILVYVATHIA